jgi:SAM-dependent methyltransferase
MSITSPLSLSKNTTLVRDICKKEIIKQYDKHYGIDISAYFQDIEKISIIHCNDTGYKFYYPFNLAGDSMFYKFFQNFDWYYMPWKWEHDIAKGYINNDYKILEVGCAHGAFLKKINELFKLKLTVGLELNESTKVNDLNFEIRNETIQYYSNENKGVFDLVCLFQVLEHVSDVHDFLKSTINCLKKGGVLILSVPNNNSFLKKSNSCLNMPPHHVGLWDEQSLIALSNIFPLKVLNIHYEELQTYHVDGELYSVYYSKYNAILSKIIIRLHKLIGIYQKRYKVIMNNRNNIVGHTILVAYEKL